eukprot:UN16971
MNLIFRRGNDKFVILSQNLIQQYNYHGRVSYAAGFLRRR